VSFSVTPQAIPDVLVIEHPRFADERGFFCETHREGVFAEHGIGPLVQDNHSRSTHGVLRGLHFQEKPRALGKLVRCVRGRIFDVAVDIRPNSATYRQWVGLELGEDDNLLFWLPEGFAHGFCTLTDVADVLYRQTDYYSPEHDRSIAWNDPSLNIDWPIAAPLLSAKDARAPRLQEIADKISI
jgi:dTDP-4-dehydrorhamnose 3,5-epimerase